MIREMVVTQVKPKKIKKKVIKTTVWRAYKYRVYPNKETAKKALEVMKTYAYIWNNALRERKENYKARQKDKNIKPISAYGQYHLIRKREHPEFQDLNAQSMQCVLSELDSSYKSFFNLTKKDKTARPPKFKEMFNSITYTKSGWKIVRNNILLIKNIGKFRIRLHRPIDGEIKTVNIKLKNKKWYVVFSIKKTLYRTVKTKNKKVKISFEDYLFLKDNYGNEIKHPQFYFTEIKKLRRLSRALSRKKEGSKNWKKAKYTLQKWHEHISNKRKHFLWHIANEYTKKYDEINVPKVPLKKKIMQSTNSFAAQRLCDAAYGIFVKMLYQKSEENECDIIEYAL
ncbi:MAG: RNA-guided endonuclease InsQ/TnpB family protein [Candidatus Woesearchaeota archaeon]